MTISLFELFKIGVGPSSSHTVGPMVAARRFAVWLDEHGLLTKTAHVEADLYGSLALTGKGHAADTAVVAGLAGEIPASTSFAAIKAHWDRATSEGFLYLLGRQRVRFQPASDLHFQMKQRQPFHSNALSFTVRDGDGEILAKRMYFSIGGGFVVDEDEAGRNSRGAEDEVELPFPFTSGADLIAMGAASGKSFAEMMLDNELVHRSLEQVGPGSTKSPRRWTARSMRAVRAPASSPAGSRSSAARRRSPPTSANGTKRTCPIRWR
jgi:L-serine dehydratase